MYGHGNIEDNFFVQMPLVHPFGSSYVWLALWPRISLWTILFGAGFLAGIGFTMSIFVSGLALEGAQLSEGISGTLLGSTLSALFGMLILHIVLKQKAHYQFTMPLTVHKK